MRKSEERCSPSSRRRSTSSHRSWPASLPQMILGDVITKAREYAGTLGPRSNDVHLAANDIEQLRNFVNPVLSHDAADARHTGVTFGRPDRALLFGADLHRPQLEDH